MILRQIFIVSVICVLASCASAPPPRDINNLCNIFKQYPKWHQHTLAVYKRWHVPVAVQMAIMHQESKFDSCARPARKRLLWVIPWVRPSTAYGYAQALTSTWKNYKDAYGGMFASRTNFADGVDFIGWYANVAYQKAGIPQNNAYALYLAYHEGIGGYLRKTYLQKGWLINVAHKVSARAQLYQAQLARCPT